MTMLTPQNNAAYATSAAPHWAAGIGVLNSTAAKSRLRKLSGFFHALVYPFTGGRAGGAARLAGAVAGTPTLASVAHPIGVGLVAKTTDGDTIMNPSTPTSAFDANSAYHLTEDQHTAIYQARHLLGLVYDLSTNQQEFCELHYEHIAVSIGLIADLLDSAIPGLVWRKS